MTANILIRKNVNIKHVCVSAHVRYTEDATLNGVDDVDGNIYGYDKNTERWEITIDIDEGNIIDWRTGDTASVHYKVCDECQIQIMTDDSLEVYNNEDYVPDFLCPKEEGYGDYIIMDIDENGHIDNWNPSKVVYFLENNDREDY